MAMSVVYTNFGGMLVHEDRGGAERQYVSDTLGSLIGELDSTQTTTYTAEYWPYGEVQTETGTNTSPWNFVGLLGYLRDLASLLYVRARHYLNAKARWLTVDPLWPKQLPFGYVMSHPSYGVDPNGLEEVTLGGGLGYGIGSGLRGGVGPMGSLGTGSLIGLCLFALQKINEWDRARQLEQTRRLRLECRELMKEYKRVCGQNYEQWIPCNEGMSCNALKLLIDKYKRCSAMRRLYKIKCLRVDEWNEEHQFPIDLARQYFIDCFNIWKDTGCDA